MGVPVTLVEPPASLVTGAKVGQTFQSAAWTGQKTCATDCFAPGTSLTKGGWFVI